MSERNNDRAFTVERLEYQKLCFTGLAEKPAPRLKLFAPDGGRTETRAEWASGFSHEVGIWDWSFAAGMIGGPLSRLGTYRFELTGQPAGKGKPAGELTLSGRIAVAPATKPRTSFSYHPLASPADQRIRAGGRVAVQFAGYPPGTRHFLTVYAPDQVDLGFRPLADLPEVVIPPSGEATVQWKSPARAAPGHYGIWVQSTPVQPGDCNADLCEIFEIEP